MGQYYTPVALATKKDKDGYLEPPRRWYSHNYGSELKLTEHSWVGNHFTGTVLSYLVNNPCKLWWLGDYAEKSDLPEFSDAAFRFFYNFAWPFDDPIHEETPNLFDSEKSWVILNHTKKEYFDWLAYRRDNTTEDGWCLNPLPLLTAVGNGRGGGDYYGENQQDIGRWAGNEIEIGLLAPDDYRQINFEFKEE